MAVLPLAYPRLRQVFGEHLAQSSQRHLPAFTARRVVGPVHFPGKAVAVVGMRRAGKTTFLHQLRSERVQQGTPLECLPYISFEDERLAGVEAERLSVLVDEYHRQYPDLGGSAPMTWYLDEIHLIPGWEQFVRRLLAAEGTEVYVTGSSADLLSREVATALRGRAWQVLIHPFSFEEALRHRGLPRPSEPSAMSVRERSRGERALMDWLQEGGFPETQGLDTHVRHQVLRDYVDVAMLRDVVERHEVRNVSGLRWLVRHLLGNAGARFSAEKFHAALKSQGLAIAKDTVHQLLGFLEDCFLVRIVWMESKSERQRMANPRKAYPVDTGLIPVFDRTGRANLGHALETAVLVELERRRCEVTYVRTAEGYEVDFLARGPTGEADLIQVCIDPSDPATATREFRALDSAARQFPFARKRLLTLTHDALPEEVPSGLEVQTASEWLLQGTAAH